MKTRFLTTTLLLTIFISACGGNAPQPTFEVATNTSAVSTSTQTQAPATETTVPATEAPTTDSTQATSGGVSFANDIAPIFQASCNNCHGIQQVKEGLDLTTYETLMEGSFNGTVITPGNADDSYLVEQIVKGEMPKRGPKLTSDQIQLIIDWINQGALNN